MCGSYHAIKPAENTVISGPNVVNMHMVVILCLNMYNDASKMTVAAEIELIKGQTNTDNNSLIDLVYLLWLNLSCHSQHNTR
jgi:hypothetical protein